MPEIRFQIQWSDGSEDICYSPSLIVKEYFTPETEYTLVDFVQRSQTALKIARDRVQAKYGMPCSLALNQLHQIETKAAQYQNLPEATVQVIQFLD